MTTDSPGVWLEIVPERRKRVDLHPRHDVARPEIARTPDLDASDAEEGHLPGRGASAPRSGHYQRDEKECAQDLPAGFAKTLARDHCRRFSRRSLSSGPVRVMSPAPIVITTSPSRTNPV